MSFLGNVNWNEVEDSGFKPLPAGTYGAKITSAAISPNKKGNGKYIKLELTLIGQKGVKGRKVFEYLTIEHPNEMVVNIALKKMKSLIQLLGKDPDEIENPNELIGEMIGINLKVTDEEKFGPQNKLSYFVEFDEDFINKTSDGDDLAF